MYIITYAFMSLTLIRPIFEPLMRVPVQLLDGSFSRRFIPRRFRSATITLIDDFIPREFRNSKISQLADFIRRAFDEMSEWP